MFIDSLDLLFLLAFGLLQLFFGYPLFRVLIVITGAAFGFAYGPTMLATLAGRAPEPWVALAAALAAAVVLGLLAWFAFRAVVFLWGAAVGYGLAAPLAAGPFLPLIVALLVGILAVVFQRVVIVALTALSGAWLVVGSAATLIGYRPPLGPWFDVGDIWLTVAALGLSAVGAAVQFGRAEGLS